MPASLEDKLKNLKGTQYSITSPRTRFYNCVAFAASETRRWWWPTVFSYWPENVPREETLQAFILAFRTLGYNPCEDGELESGFEKVAIYADEDKVPSHMARQLPSGVWISKCGRMEDIEHETLAALEGSKGEGYGKVVQFLRRPL
jgi:hypothetical protein